MGMKTIMARESILIVEDNPTNLKLVQLLLKMEGYNVRVAVDAIEFFKVLETFHPELILMDIQLPRKNGLDLARDIRNDPKLNGISIVALTAFAMKGDKEKAIEAGFDGYMTKPISVETFPAKITQYLAQQKKTAAAYRNMKR